ncbi:hypothetical protein DUNSADRAFT_5149 [Dunaliella salina]|uniref:HRDC domain-containing protein n=1 Tax=Dunaliella salina TaxID=3046 RepID=A0ABQ7H7E6_DUNSA|nr:hypothetical protein DUNSADRAFT_5149 [Dunaliella salina]|eukprot:KAF5842777.1 hypothetical protein DUNSADRAFT_5149 [Dunaliella salina]
MSCPTQDSPEYRAAYDAVAGLRSWIAEHKNSSTHNILKPLVVEALARKVPRTLDELRKVEGLAETKITSFGHLILQVIQEALQHAAQQRAGLIPSGQDFVFRPENYSLLPGQMDGRMLPNSIGGGGGNSAGAAEPSGHGAVGPASGGKRARLSGTPTHATPDFGKFAFGSQPSNSPLQQQQQQQPRSPAPFSTAPGASRFRPAAAAAGGGSDCMPTATGAGPGCGGGGGGAMMPMQLQQTPQQQPSWRNLNPSVHGHAGFAGMPGPQQPQQLQQPMLMAMQAPHMLPAHVQQQAYHHPMAVGGLPLPMMAHPHTAQQQQQQQLLQGSEQAGSGVLRFHQGQ